jgi:uncharacterized repeat protein (TIGR03803 family)
MENLIKRKAACVLLLCAATAAVASPAQTFATLVNFNGSNGTAPDYECLVQGIDGNFYGTTAWGGANGGAYGYGTIFKITPSGALTTLYSFAGTDGSLPYTGLVQATNGYFYGTTYGGGVNGYGTIFKITPSGTLTTLYSFAGSDGVQPFGGLVQGTDGNFYGTTFYGGFYGGANGYGTVFKITPSGRLTTLYSFAGNDGKYPAAGLIQATSGSFYGTTEFGGANDYGTIFKITPGGTLTTLYSFAGVDGGIPAASLVQARNGNFYGTTYSGGVGYGTVFKITPSGTLETLYSFAGTSASNPASGLIQATNGSFYGATQNGGSNNCSLGCGTIFEITPGGTLTILIDFGGINGAQPIGGLVQGTDGTFYGTTDGGGSIGRGTVFSLALGLGPFVKTLHTSGKVGTAVKILGTNLTGATMVSFNGTVSLFAVISPSEITTTVPVGATTGTVKVMTPGGPLFSDVAFRVHP